MDTSNSVHDTLFVKHLDQNLKVELENHLDPVAPTGFTSRHIPFLLMMLFGLLALLITGGVMRGRSLKTGGTGKTVDMTTLTDDRLMAEEHNNMDCAMQPCSVVESSSVPTYAGKHAKPEQMIMTQNDYQPRHGRTSNDIT